MKNFLILVDKIGRKKELFAQLIACAFPPQHKVLLARFSDLVFDIDGQSVDVKIDGIDKDIADFDLVYFRRVGGKFLSTAATLAVCLKHMGIEFFDTTYGSVGPAGDKFTSYTRLALAGLPTMPSFFCSYRIITRYVDKIISKFGLPLVAKQLSSQRGKGVFLVKERSDFEGLAKKFPERGFMFQKFYESCEEYRILVLKNTIGAYERKIRTDPNEFRSNIALGAIEEFIDISKIPAQIKEVSQEAAKTLNIEVAGVDVLVDKNGKVWLLEVNRGPGLTYDTQISPELPNMAKFFARELRRRRTKDD